MHSMRKSASTKDLHPHLVNPARHIMRSGDNPDTASKPGACSPISMGALTGSKGEGEQGALTAYKSPSRCSIYA